MMECTAMMDGTGMMVWGLVSFLLVLLVLFLFVLAVAYAVKRMWGQGSERASGREDNALDTEEALRERRDRERRI